MIKHILIETKYLLILPAFFISSSLFGQGRDTASNLEGKKASPTVWEQAKVDATGGNHINGVDVFYRLDNCNSKQYIMLKFVNHNTEDVQIEWADAVYTEDQQWLHNERHDKERLIKVKAEETVYGSCASKSEVHLRVDAGSLLRDAKKKFTFAPSYIEVSR